MDQDLQMLVQLQLIDSAMDVLKLRMDEYPGRIRVLESDLEEAEKELTGGQNQIEELEKEQRHYERELQNTNHELDKHNKRLFEIKTNEEYQALLKEIDVLKEHVEEFEGQILERMTTLDDLSEDIQSLEGRFNSKKEDTARHIQELKTELAGVQEELDHRQQEREKLVVDIHSKLMRTYERVRAKNKTAVVPVQKEACGGCFERLPPQRINEIRRNDNLIFCENCGSILVWDEECVLNNNHSGKTRKERPEQNR